MTRQRQCEISDALWDSHKSSIRRLYLSEGRSLEGRNGVRETMKRKGLHGSKSQYELHFKRWGFRKYLKKAEWHAIRHAVDRRQCSGLSSYVFFLDEQLSVSKVRKEMNRSSKCGEGTGERCRLDGLQIPDGVEIREYPQSDNTPRQSDEHDSTSFGMHTPDEEIGTSEAESVLQTAAECSITQHGLMESVGQVQDLQLCDYFHNETSGPLLSSLSSWPLIPSRLPTPSSAFEADVTWLLSNDLDLHQARHHFAEDLDRPTIPSNTISLMKFLKRSLLQDFEAACSVALSSTDPGVNKTMRLLPWTAHQDLQISPDNTVIVKQVMFLLMNNFAGSNHAGLDSLFEQVKRFSITQVKDILHAIPPPYSNALQHSILTIAIRSNVPAIVRILLQKGLEFERITCRSEGSPYTPLALACKFRRLEICRMLIDSGLDVNQAEFSTQETAMHTLIGPAFASPSTFSDNTSDIFVLLLDAGAKVGWQELENINFWRDSQLLGAYLKHGTSATDFRYGYQLHRPLMNAMKFCNLEQAAIAVEKMLGSRASIEKPLLSDIADRCMAALQHASYQGNEALVDYFLSIGLHPDLRCLCQAIRGNHRAILMRYITSGADVDVVEGADHHTMNLVRNYAGEIPLGAEPLLQESISIRYGRTTPFAEAIRWNHHDLVRDFGAMGIFKTITEHERFSAALLAAAEAGNTPIVDYLLGRAAECPGLITSALSASISIATLGNHESIVEILMLAGIKPIASSITMAILVRNTKLVRLFLDAGVSIMDTIGLTYLAVRWGDLDVIKELIEAGAPINESGCDLGIVELNNPNIEPRSPLGEAIWRGRDDLVELLIERGARVSGGLYQPEPSPLAVAIQCGGNEPLVRKLLARGASPCDPNAILAATLHSEDMTGLVLGAMFRQNPAGDRYVASGALRRAIRNRNLPIIRILANHTDLNDKEQRRDEAEVWSGIPERSGRMRAFLPTLLGEAISTKDTRLVRVLLDSGGDPNSTVDAELSGRRGRWPAVSLAIDTGDLSMVTLLHETGANLHYDATLRITRTALQFAVEKGNYDIVEFLLNNGADTNAAPCIWGGGTALKFAASNGFVGIAELLLSRGANVNASRSKFRGRTAFESAAEHGRLDMLLLLYHKGVDIVSDGGRQARRAMRFAEKNGQVAAMSLVEKLAEGSTSGAFHGRHELIHIA